MTYPDQVIGSYNSIPWHLPEDLKWFRKHTTNKTVIMGKKTYISIGKPLKNRQNIILTSDLDYASSYNIDIAHSIDEAFSIAKNEIFIIGGASLYEQTISVVNRLYITWIYQHIKGDTYFPKINLEDWNKVYSKSYRHTYDFEFCIYEK